MAIRVFHFSDTHLGHQQYPRTDANGLNQREQDHAAAFHAVIDRAVAERPDLVIHAGDLFDGVRPSNRALATAQEGFLKLSRAGIPAIVIAGNHEHPKLRETGSAFRLYDSIEGIHPVYAGRVEPIALELGGQRVILQAVPQLQDNSALAKAIAAIPAKPTDALQLLVVHGAVTTLQAFSHAEFNEQSLDPSWFDARFDYVALGHFHGVKEIVAGKAWYCGAPERVSIAEAGEAKGFLDVTVKPGRSEATFRVVEGRPYVDLPPIHARNLGAEAIVAAARQSLERTPAGAVARLRIRDLDPSLRGSIDLRAIHEAGKHLVHLDLSKLDWRQDESNSPGARAFGHLPDEFAAFAARTPLDGVDRDELLRLAKAVFAGAPLDGVESAAVLANDKKGGEASLATGPTNRQAEIATFATSQAGKVRQ